MEAKTIREIVLVTYNNVKLLLIASDKHERQIKMLQRFQYLVTGGLMALSYIGGKLL